MAFVPWNVPPDTPLYPARLKIERAKTHFYDLSDQIESFTKTKPNSIVFDTDTKTGEQIARIRVHHKPSPYFALMIGDVLHNLRAALDIAVVELVRDRRGKNGQVMSRTALDTAGFPIKANRQGFETAAMKEIKGVSPAADALIRSLEPYKGGGWKGSLALWQLHQLDILDKHKLIIPSVTHMKTPGVGFFIPAGSPSGTASFTLGPKAIGRTVLNDGDVIARYSADRDPNLQINIQASFEISFGNEQIMDGEPVIPTLTRFGELVEEIVATLGKTTRHA
jgi:hypothetical protein